MVSGAQLPGLRGDECAAPSCGDASDASDASELADADGAEMTARLRRLSTSDDNECIAAPATPPSRPSRARGALRGTHVAAVPGLRLVYDAVSEEEERAALAAIASDRGTPANNIHRATQWGWRFYTYNRAAPMSEADRLAPLPAWQRATLAALLAADAARDFLPSESEWGAGVSHALLNEYEPGDGVAPHTDDVSFWTQFVLGLSLGSAVTMRFLPPFDVAAVTAVDAASSAPPPPPHVDVWLPRRSLYVLTGDARWKWRHEIVRATEDVVDGVAVPRSYRASVTWRGIAERWLPRQLREQAAGGDAPAPERAEDAQTV